MLIRKSILVVLGCLCCVLWAQTAPTNAPDPFKPIAFLIGTWEAKTRGGFAEASTSGTYSFEPELKNHVLVRHAINAACKGPADFNCEHNDVLYVYSEGQDGSLKAISFDNEGHVIYYDVTAQSPTTAVFLSHAAKAGPQFRLTYELKGSTMFGTFEIRLPSQTEFRTYLEWSGNKVTN